MPGEPNPPAGAAAGTPRALRLPRSPKVIAGLVILVVFAVVAVIGAWIAPYSPNLTNESWVQHVLVAGTGPGTHIKADYYPLPLPPSGAHWLGTTVFAQDVWSQLLVSTQATVAVGLLAAAISTALSIIVGVTAGYLGGGADEGLSLVGNVFLAIPGNRDPETSRRRSPSGLGCRHHLRAAKGRHCPFAQWSDARNQRP